MKPSYAKKKASKEFTPGEGFKYFHYNSDLSFYCWKYGADEDAVLNVAVISSCDDEIN